MAWVKYSLRSIQLSVFTITCLAIQSICVTDTSTTSSACDVSCGIKLPVDVPADEVDLDPIDVNLLQHSLTLLRAETLGDEPLASPKARQALKGSRKQLIRSAALNQIISLLGLSAKYDTATTGVDIIAVKENSWGLILAIGLVVLLPLIVLYAFVKNRTLDSASSEQMSIPYSSLAIVTLFVYVLLLMGSDIMANSVAQLNGGLYPWNPVLVIWIVETLKLAASIMLSLFEKFFARRTEAESLPNTVSRLGRGNLPQRWDWSLAFKGMIYLLPIATLYAGNNCVSLFVLGKMQVDSYVIWRNVGILFNAIIWSQYFNRKLATNQLLGVISMFAGVCLSDIQIDGTLGIMDWPILLVIGGALGSALSAVLNEGVFKSDAFKNVSINTVNCILYAETSMILAVALFVYRITSSEDVALFQNLDRYACAFIAIQMTLGLCVSRVLKYADAVAKVVAGGVRELATLLIAPLFVASRLDWISCCSGLWIFFAVVIYFIPTPHEIPAHPQVPSPSNLTEKPENNDGNIANIAKTCEGLIVNDKSQGVDY